MLIVEFVFIFEVVFQNNSNYCVLVGHAYVLSFRPVALQIRTIPGGVGGKHWVIMLASPAKLGLGNRLTQLLFIKRYIGLICFDKTYCYLLGLLRGQPLKKINETYNRSARLLFLTSLNNFYQLTSIK